jgi:hypothetical protein
MSGNLDLKEWMYTAVAMVPNPVPSANAQREWKVRVWLIVNFMSCSAARMALSRLSSPDRLMVESQAACSRSRQTPKLTGPSSPA